MKNIYTLFLFLLIFSGTCIGQHGTLVEDFREGPQGSVKSKAVLFEDDVYYLGRSSDTPGLLLKYNISSNEISVVTPTNDLVFTYLDIHASENNIYLNSSFGLYQYNPSTNAINLIFWTDPFDTFKKIYVHQGIFVLTTFESSSNSWTAYYYNESTGVTKKMMDYIDINNEELLVTIGDDYIAIRSSSIYFDPLKPSSLFDRSNGNQLNIENVIPDFTCGPQYTLQTIGKYLFYHCDFDDYYFNTSTLESSFFETNPKELGEDEQYLFVRASGNRLLSIDKINNSSTVINEGRHTNLLKFENKYYSIDYENQALIQTEGGIENTLSFPLNIELDRDSEIVDMIRINEKVLLLIDQDLSDFYIYELQEENVTLILEDLKMLGRRLMPFYDAQGKLLFSYDNEMYGEELFLLDLETNSVENFNYFPINVFPNPATTFLNLDEFSNQYKVSIISSLGVNCLKLNSGNNDISILPNGLYYIKIQELSSKKCYHKPLVVAK